MILILSSMLGRTYAEAVNGASLLLSQLCQQPFQRSTGGHKSIDGRDGMCHKLHSLTPIGSKASPPIVGYRGLRVQ